MANNFKEAALTINAETDAATARLNSGFLRLYDGTQPATADTAIAAQVLLAELTFGNPAYAAAVAGVAAVNAITKDSSANATGTATWFRAVTSGGAAVFDGSVGTSGCDLNMDSVAIQINAEVSVSTLPYTHPASS